MNRVAMSAPGRATAVILLLASSMQSLFAETPPEQEAAVKAIRGFASNVQKNRDGTVRFVRFSKALVKDEHVARIAAFTQLDYLAVVSPNVTDEGLSSIGELKNLDTVFLSGSGVTNLTVQRLAGLPKLERLYLDDLPITDEALSSIAEIQPLTTLSLNRTKITDGGASVIARLPKLQSLSLKGCSITDRGLAALAACSSLRTLLLDDSAVTGSGLQALAAHPNLETLGITGLEQIDPKHLGALAAAPKLKHILHYQINASVELQTAFQDALSPRTIIHMSPPPAKDRNSLQRYLAGDQLLSGRRGSSEFERPPEPENPRAVKADFAEQTPDFQRHVMPLFGRLGCNGRTCHGSFQGQGGFSLSMFGFDFQADHDALLKGDEPRVNLKDPSNSLIVNMPTLKDEHGGGQRFEPGGWEQKMLLKWIESGAEGVLDAPTRIARLEIEPTEVIFTSVGQKVQLRSVAVWENGSREDVTRFTRFQSNDEAMTTVTVDGLVTSLSAGDTHVVAFYDNAVTPVPTILPVGEQFGENYPRIATTTKIDELIVEKLAKLGMIPADRCTDAEFLRRLSLDLVGTLPSESEVREFLADQSADKRTRKIDQLLGSPAYAEWWSVMLADLTGSNAQYLGSTDMNQPAAGQWNRWLHRRLRDNVSWDRIAAGILLATSRRPGQTYDEYAAEQSGYLRRTEPDDYTAADNPMHYYWFRSNNQQPTDRALSFGYVFLGVRLQCAQCHKHPFDQWSKQDFDHFTQFFTRIKSGAAPDALTAQLDLKAKLGVPKKLDTAALRRQMYLRVSAEGLPIPWNEIYIQPPTAKPQTAKVLGGGELDLNDYDDPREPLVAWLLSKENPYFARAFVNRVWAHYFGVGIVDPPDDLNLANPPSNKKLLDWLAEEFVNRQFDIRWVHRTILLSDAYQRGHRANDTNRTDRQNFSRALLRRTAAEVTVDAILRATASDDVAARYLTSVKGRKIGQHPKSIQARGIDYSLLVFGKPLRTTNCDCERQMQPTLLQSLFVRNDSEMLAWLERKDGWLVQVARELGETLSAETDSATPPAAKPNATAASDERLRELVAAAYFRTVSRPPSGGELERGVAHLKSTENRVEGLRDLLWALLNCREFITNH